MSFLTGWQKLGCVIYALLGALISAWAWPISGGVPLYIFPTIPIAALLGGAALLTYFASSRNA